MWEDKERDKGLERDRRVKDRYPVEIKMSECTKADAHLPGIHTFPQTHRVCQIFLHTVHACVPTHT